ncbi:MAG: hypothetical protein P4L51_27435 [Puia sp.]|nr:hypothetical protein [Puia sp.]
MPIITDFWSHYAYIAVFVTGSIHLQYLLPGIDGYFTVSQTYERRDRIPGHHTGLRTCHNPERGHELLVWGAAFYKKQATRHFPEMVNDS